MAKKKKRRRRERSTEEWKRGKRGGQRGALYGEEEKERIGARNRRGRTVVIEHDRMASEDCPQRADNEEP
jgi:hypothetical protein